MCHPSESPAFTLCRFFLTSALDGNKGALDGNKGEATQLLFSVGAGKRQEKSLFWVAEGIPNLPMRTRSH
jgi:hypothetical protein